MKIAIIGQQDFGKAVLEAFLKRGDTVAAVFCAPEKEGARPDALRVAAQAARLTVHQFKSLRAPEAVAAMRAADADIGALVRTHDRELPARLLDARRGDAQIGVVLKRLDDQRFERGVAETREPAGSHCSTRGGAAPLRR